MMTTRVVWACGLVAVVACSHPSQVSFVSNERPTAPGAQGGAQGGVPPRTATQSEQSKSAPGELPNDDEIVEPDRPAADSKQERALVHIHGPNGIVCSGVMLAPSIVATAQQCLKTEAKGATTLPASHEYRVEVASSTLTWTNRRAKHAVLPACSAEAIDVGLLVLAEPAQWVQPLRIVSAPSTGAKVQALGFGHCEGETRSVHDRIGTVRSRVSEAIVIDVPLCKGDAGGPVVDGTGGDVIGVISRRDDPEGSPLRTTTIARLDTTQVRALIEQANQLLAGTDVTTLTAVPCH